MGISPAVTVIVPVYNVSAYIGKCARSLFEQTLENLEILFVDDCSSDNSVEIIRKIVSEYPEKKKLTRIIHMPANIGQAGVRLRGIIEAKGRYVIHLDGDDWIDRDYYQSMYDAAVESHADIVIGDEVMEYASHTVPKNNEPLPSDGKQILRLWYRNTVGLFCHNKLVKRTLYTDNGILPWSGLNMWEDNGLFARLFYYARKVVQTHGPVYHYNRTNVRAMTAGYGEKQVDQMIAVAEHLAVFFQSKPDAHEFEKTVYAFKYLAKLNLISDSFANYRRFKSLFPESDSIVSELDRNAFTVKGRIRFHIVRFGFAPVFILLFKIKNILK